MIDVVRHKSIKKKRVAPVRTPSCVPLAEKTCRDEKHVHSIM